MVDLGIPGIADAVKIAGGGFGDVFCATQPNHGRTVAVKVLRGYVDDDVRRRFDRERLAMGRLSSGHDGIVMLYESGYSAGGQPYLVMPWIDGGTARARFEADGPFPADAVVDHLLQLADALRFVHAEGVLHRDLKPDNVLLHRPGPGRPERPLLTDLGIAAVFESEATATMAMTPGYAPPEVLIDQIWSPTGDVWCLAATVAAMALGRAPFEGDTAYAKMEAIRTGPAPDLAATGLPLHVRAALDRCFVKDPAARTPTVDALLADIQARHAITVADETEELADPDDLDEPTVLVGPAPAAPPPIGIAATKFELRSAVVLDGRARPLASGPTTAGVRPDPAAGFPPASGADAFWPLDHTDLEDHVVLGNRTVPVEELVAAPLARALDAVRATVGTADGALVIAALEGHRIRGTVQMLRASATAGRRASRIVTLTPAMALAHHVDLGTSGIVVALAADDDGYEIGVFRMGAGEVVALAVELHPRVYLDDDLLAIVDRLGDPTLGPVRAVLVAGADADDVEAAAARVFPGVSVWRDDDLPAAGAAVLAGALSGEIDGLALTDVVGSDVLVDTPDGPVTVVDATTPVPAQGHVDLRAPDGGVLVLPIFEGTPVERIPQGALEVRQRRGGGVVRVSCTVDVHRAVHIGVAGHDIDPAWSPLPVQGSGRAEASTPDRLLARPLDATGPVADASGPFVANGSSGREWHEPTPEDIDALLGCVERSEEEFLTIRRLGDDDRFVQTIPGPDGTWVVEYREGPGRHLSVLAADRDGALGILMDWIEQRTGWRTAYPWTPLEI